MKTTRKLFALILVLLLLSACGVPSSLYDYTDDERSAIVSACTFTQEFKCKSDFRLTGDPVVVWDEDGLSYVYLPVSFTADGAERTEIAMFEATMFAGFDSEDVPDVIYGPGSVPTEEGTRLIRLRTCKEIYAQYEIYGTWLTGRSVGDSGLKIASVSVLDQKKMTRYLEYWVKTVG